jgi:hypothetical protein
MAYYIVTAASVFTLAPALEMLETPPIGAVVLLAIPAPGMT